MAFHATNIDNWKTRKDLTENKKRELWYTRQNYRTGILSTAQTIAHELNHVLTSHLNGGPRPGTPTGIGKGTGSSAQPEHGWAWEGKVFPGFLDVCKDPHDPCGENQFGRLYRQYQKGGEIIVCPYDDKYIFDIINFSKSPCYGLSEVSKLYGY